MSGLADQVAALEAERAMLADLNDRLAARLTVLEDTERDHRRELRETYRAGYFAGHSAGQRGASVCAEPERRTRGRVRRLLIHGAAVEGGGA